MAFVFFDFFFRNYFVAQQLFSNLMGLKALAIKGKPPSKSDIRERKAYELIKKVPPLRFAYAPVRGVVYACRGNKQEAFRSFTLNLNFNILEYPKNTIKAIKAIRQDHKKGIWMGNRPLKTIKIPFSAKIFNLDGQHTAILIDGIIYQLQRVGKKTKIVITESHEEFDSFTWSLAEKVNKVPLDELRTYAMKHHGKSYKLLFPDKETENCQSFAQKMLDFCQCYHLKTKANQKLR